MPTAGTLTPPEAGAATSTLAASPVVCCLKLFAASSGTLVSVGSLMSYVPALLYFGLSIVTGVSNVNSGTISVSGSTAVTLIATTLGLSPGRSVVKRALTVVLENEVEVEVLKLVENCLLPGIVSLATSSLAASTSVVLTADSIG